MKELEITERKGRALGEQDKEGTQRKKKEERERRAQLARSRTGGREGPADTATGLQRQRPRQRSLNEHQR